MLGCRTDSGVLQLVRRNARDDGVSALIILALLYQVGTFFLEMVTEDIAKHVLIMGIFGGLLRVLLEKKEIAKEEIVAWCNRLESISSRHRRKIGGGK